MLCIVSLAEYGGARRQAGDGICRHHVGNALRGFRSVGPEPLGGPVERSEKCARRQGRILRAEDAAAHAVGDQRPHAAFVAVALGDDRRAQALGKRVELEVRRRSLHFVDEAQDVRGGEPAQPLGERLLAAACLIERRQQPIERTVLAEVEQFVLTLEIVVEVARRQVGGERNVAHAGCCIAAVAEDACGGAEDADAAGVGAK